MQCIPTGVYLNQPRALCGQVSSTIEKVLLALQNEAPEIKVEQNLRERAWRSIPENAGNCI
ncbi:hypothetical protein MASR1M46_17440 [Bacteroidales bacterium]